MPNINIENISDLDINGNNLFEDSESFITEITDDNEQSVVGGFYSGYYRGWNFKNPGKYYKGRWRFKKNRPFRKTHNCGNTIGGCANTIGGAGFF